jgi:ParB family chromosome partitioning protein
VRQRERTADIDELAYSIDTFGLQQPIVVQPRGKKFEVLIGQRRYLAAKQLGWDSIPARVQAKPLKELDAKVVSFSENIQRRDLAPQDKADACAYLMEKLGEVRKVAEHLGITEQTVRKWLEYAGVPDSLKSMVTAGRLTRPVATRIALSVPDEKKALAIARRLVDLKPPKAQQDRILEAAEEAPSRSVEGIFRRAEQLKERKRITFVLPEQYGPAMNRATKRLGLSDGDIARDATIDFLKQHKY